jgi:protein-L-isoaspartate(D-aspartate) O-methyltransferase
MLAPRAGNPAVFAAGRVSHAPRVESADITRCRPRPAGIMLAMSHKNRRRRVLCLVLGVLVTALAACGGDVPEADQQPGQAASPGAAVAGSPGGSPLETAAPTRARDDDRFRAARLELIEEGVKGLGVKDERVLQAMREVPRHRFIPDDQVSRAYNNRPLPIGFGQTISQPYIVGLMSELLDVQPGEKVLEIGTGSGYQGAVLAELTDKVWSIEIIPELARRADSTLDELGYEVEVKQADGYFGWPEHAPFDGIIVTAAPDHMPQPLIQQLAEGGKLVIPVGAPGSYQTLWRVTKRNGQVVSENITDVVFVPLVRKRS